MAKFMIFYRSSRLARDQMANATAEQMQAGMDAWMAWAGQAGDAVVDLGSPLAHATYIGSGSGSEDIAGYSILQAESAQAVASILGGHPHLEMPGSSIEVLEMLTIPGM